jgi:hypothetical protein
MSSTSIPVSDQRPAVVTGPTIADAQLLVQIMAAGVAAGADRGIELLQARSEPPTLAQLRDEHPRTGEEYRQVMALLGQCEMIGTFVKQGVLNGALVDDLIWVAGGWRITEQICRDLRAEAGEPRLYENFEWLASRSS